MTLAVILPSVSINGKDCRPYHRVSFKKIEVGAYGNIGGVGKIGSLKKPEAENLVTLFLYTETTFLLLKKKTSNV
jgi:hypothetical protein